MESLRWVPVIALHASGMAVGAPPSRPAALTVKAHRAYLTRNVDPFQRSLLPPAHFARFAVLLDVKCTRHESRPAQPSFLSVRLTRRLANAGPPAVQPAPRLAPNVQCAVPTTHRQSQRSPNSDTKTHSPAAQGQQSQGTGHPLRAS